MARKEESNLRHHPDIEPFLIRVETTGNEIGRGAYGRVLEMRLFGAACVAKEIHEALSQEGISTVTDAFLRECKIMSTLRHPHITQFLGFCFLDKKTAYPALVMERLATNLHDTLLSKDIHLPLGLKFSVLRDVACGLAYLHYRSVIHRDLNAANILLTAGMEAKIADFGMARKIQLKMTDCPGHFAYMPPEALEKPAIYSTPVDVFSWGILTIFTLTQQFPEPLPATFQSQLETKMRSEVERREAYIQQIRQKYRSQGHSTSAVIPLIQACLHNNPFKRPTIAKVLEQVTVLKECNLEKDATLTKLQFIQQIADMKNTVRAQKNEINHLEKENRAQKEEISKLKAEREIQLTPSPPLLATNLLTNGQRARRSTISVSSFPKDAETVSLLGQECPKRRSGSLRKSEISSPHLKMPPLPATDNIHKTLCSKKPLVLKWRQGKDAKFGCFGAQAVTIRQTVYVGGGYVKKQQQENIVQVYNVAEDSWNQAECPAQVFSLCSNGESLLVSCDMENGPVLSMTHGTWQQKEKLRSTPVGRIYWSSAFMCSGDYFAFACGLDKEKKAMKSVSIYNTRKSQWHTAQPLPIAGHSMCSVVFDDTWYLSGVWEGTTPRIYRVSIRSLIEDATNGQVTLWKELPNPPTDHFHLFKFRDTLTIVGGKDYSQDIYQYDEDAKAWYKAGILPVGLNAPIATELPHSGELLVACGSEKGKPFSESVWIGQVVD